jgi:hypothetical protein
MVSTLGGALKGASPQCPLWVISRHLQRTSQCPLRANSGHPATEGSRLRCHTRQATDKVSR